VVVERPDECLPVGGPSSCVEDERLSEAVTEPRDSDHGVVVKTARFDVERERR
jgi:hypothetical protein